MWKRFRMWSRIHPAGVLRVGPRIMAAAMQRTVHAAAVHARCGCCPGSPSASGHLVGAQPCLQASALAQRRLVPLPGVLVLLLLLPRHGLDGGCSAAAAAAAAATGQLWHDQEGPPAATTAAVRKTRVSGMARQDRPRPSLQ
eukprot:1160415-Pelagomonas_calceolata.AAC.1